MMPASGSRRPMTHSTVVVFPAPFGPMSPNVSPLRISKLTPRAAAFLEIADDDFGAHRVQPTRFIRYHRRRGFKRPGGGWPDGAAVLVDFGIFTVTLTLKYLV